MERRQPLRAVRAGGSLAVGTTVQRRKGKNHQSISPPKNKSTYIISPDVAEIVVLNLLL